MDKAKAKDEENEGVEIVEASAQNPAEKGLHRGIQENLHDEMAKFRKPPTQHGLAKQLVRRDGASKFNNVYCRDFASLQGEVTEIYQEQYTRPVGKVL